MLKRHWPAVHWRDFDDGNGWQHHVDCLEGIPQELRQVFFDNGGRLLASFHSDALLQTFAECSNANEYARARPFHTSSTSAPGPYMHKTDQRRPTHVSSVDHVSVLVVRRNFTHI